MALVALRRVVGKPGFIDYSSLINNKSLIANSPRAHADSEHSGLIIVGGIGKCKLEIGKCKSELMLRLGATGELIEETWAGASGGWESNDFEYLIKIYL